VHWLLLQNSVLRSSSFAWSRCVSSKDRKNVLACFATLFDNCYESNHSLSPCLVLWIVSSCSQLYFSITILYTERKSSSKAMKFHLALVRLALVFPFAIAADNDVTSIGKLKDCVLVCHSCVPYFSSKEAGTLTWRSTNARDRSLLLNQHAQFHSSQPH
jgi:hypothetical protein